MSYPYIIQGDNLTVVIDANPHTINKTHVAYNQVVAAIKDQNWDQVRELIEPKQVLINYGRGLLDVRNSHVYWDGEQMHNALTDRIVDMIRDGFDVTPMAEFMHNLMLNPSKRAVDELYAFLESNNLPITSDGCFLAYKKVNDDYTDVHSGSVPNRPPHLPVLAVKCGVGRQVSVTCENNHTVVSMPRNRVDDNLQNTCSEGLHFCSLEYLKYFSGDRTVIVKVNPRDVVSIPVDYNRSKGRTCRYVVVGELGVAPEQAFTHAVQDNANSPQDIASDVETDQLVWPLPVDSSSAFFG